jgi:hypothetical protein
MLALYATAVLLCLCNSRVRGLLGWLPPQSISYVHEA